MNGPSGPATRCVETPLATQPDDTATIGGRLLADIRDIWPDSEHVIATETLLHRLHALEESPWADWYGSPLDARKLARLLKPYELTSTKVRIGESTPRGYRRADFHDPFSRYLGTPSGTSGTSGTPPGQACSTCSGCSGHPAHGRDRRAVLMSSIRRRFPPATPPATASRRNRRWTP